MTPKKLLPASWQVAQATPADGGVIHRRAAEVGELAGGVAALARASRRTGCACAGGVTMVTPKKLLPVAWQLSQPVRDRRRGSSCVPAKLVNLVGAWQVSHGCDDRQVRRRRRDRDDVGEALAGGVAGGAAGRDAGVVHRGDRVVARRRVAQRARLARRNVVGRLGGDAGRERGGRAVAAAAFAGRRVIRRPAPASAA